MPHDTLHVSFRLSGQEKKLMQNYAQLHNISVSAALKNAFFEKLEYEYDMNTIREYEAKKAQGDTQYFTHAEMKERLGL